MSTAGFVSHHLPAAHDTDGGMSPMVAAAFHRFAEWRRHRHAIRELSRFSDAMLKDIGITRDEIPSAILHGRRRK